MISISKGNTKLGNIPNISLVPVRDCKECLHCKSDCYAVRSYKQYPNVRNAWNKNSSSFRNNLGDTKEEIIKWFSKNKPKYFRIHVAGDFLNQEHLDIWKEVAKEFPGTSFIAFSKRTVLDFSTGTPSNLRILRSMWPTISIVPSGRIAWMQDGTESRIPSTAFQCPGSCSTCKECWTGSTDIIFKKH